MVALANAKSPRRLQEVWQEKVAPLLGTLPARQENTLLRAGMYLEQVLSYGRSDHEPPADLRKAKAALQAAREKRG